MTIIFPKSLTPESAIVTALTWIGNLHSGTRDMHACGCTWMQARSSSCTGISKPRRQTCACGSKYVHVAANMCSASTPCGMVHGGEQGSLRPEGAAAEARQPLGHSQPRLALKDPRPCLNHLQQQQHNMLGASLGGEACMGHEINIR